MNDEKQAPLMKVQAEQRVLSNLFRGYIEDVGRVEIAMAYVPDEWDETDMEVVEAWSELIKSAITEALVDLTIEMRESDEDATTE